MTRRRWRLEKKKLESHRNSVSNPRTMTPAQQYYCICVLLVISEALRLVYISAIPWEFHIHSAEITVRHTFKLIIWTLNTKAHKTCAQKYNNRIWLLRQLKAHLLVSKEKPKMKTFGAGGVDAVRMVCAMMNCGFKSIFSHLRLT